jgi:hypothetical protein
MNCSCCTPVLSDTTEFKCFSNIFKGFLWQNRLNYSGSSALVIAAQPILTQRTSNGTIRWSVGSPPDTTTVQQDRNRFTSHEGEFTITAQLINFLSYRNANIITSLFQT